MTEVALCESDVTLSREYFGAPIETGLEGKAFRVECTRRFNELGFSFVGSVSNGEFKEATADLFSAQGN